MISLSLPRSRKTCGWSNGGLAPTHMNSCEPISMTGTPASLWKCGTTLSTIWFTLSGNGFGANQRKLARPKHRTHLDPTIALTPGALAADLHMQIRHNLVAAEKP